MKEAAEKCGRTLTLLNICVLGNSRCTIFPAVNLYSPKATQLRAELDEARAAMLKARETFNRAMEIAQDTGFLNSDGTYGHRIAAENYHLLVKVYQQVLTAWVRHVLDS
jgi:hypothetical protein